MQSVPLLKTNGNKRFAAYLTAAVLGCIAVMIGSSPWMFDVAKPIWNDVSWTAGQFYNWRQISRAKSLAGMPLEKRFKSAKTVVVEHYRFQGNNLWRHKLEGDDALAFLKIVSSRTQPSEPPIEAGASLTSLQDFVQSGSEEWVANLNIQSSNNPRPQGFATSAELIAIAHSGRPLSESECISVHKSAENLVTEERSTIE